MARKKEDHKPVFLEASKEKHETKTVAARVDKKLIDRFDRAVKLAEKNGYTLSITTVVQKAIEAAIQEVEHQFNQSVDQADLSL